MPRPPFRSVPTRALVAVVLVAALIAAAAMLTVVVPRNRTQGGDRDAAAPATPDAVDAQWLDRPVRRYVALGDSFTAGPLIPFVDAAQTRCLRSSANYPTVLGRWLDARRIVDMSCAGATTSDLRWQGSALTAGTDLVTVGMGGNDFDIFGTLAGRCVGLAAGDPRGSPCRDRFVNSTGTDTLLARANRVEQRLAAGLRGVALAAGPDALVAVIGYPRIFPSTGTCPALPLARGDYGWADSVQRALNDALERAAARVGALFVDTYRASRGHGVCAGVDAWVNGRTTVATRALAFHPYAAGMRATAAAAHARLTGEPVSPGMQRRAARRADVRPAGTLTLRAQRIIAALFTGA